LQTGAGLVLIGDGTTIDGSQDTVQLAVQANGTQTANILEVQDSAGNGDILVVGGDELVGIGLTTPTADLHVQKSKDSDAVIHVRNLNTGSSARAVVKVQANDAIMSIIAGSVANGDLVSFQGQLNSGMSFNNIANAYLAFLTNNTERFRILGGGETVFGGATTAAADITLNQDGSAIFNEQGNDADFRIEGNTNINCFTLDAGNDNITINAAAVSGNYDLMLAGDGVLGLKETTTPTADTNYGKVYTKNDNKLYFQDGAGVEHEIAFV
jgi:hypothetical protein